MTIHSLVCTQLLNTNAHLGHRVAARHFQVYICGSRNGIAIIDSDKTLICLRNALHFIGSPIRQKGRSFFLKTNHVFIYEIMEEIVGCINDSKWRIGAFLTHSCSSPNQIRSRKKKINKGLIQKPDCVVILDADRKSSVILEAYRSQIPIASLVDSTTPRGRERTEYTRRRAWGFAWTIQNPFFLFLYAYLFIFFVQVLCGSLGVAYCSGGSESTDNELWKAVSPYIPSQAEGPSYQPQPLDAGASSQNLPTMGEPPCPTGGGLSLEAIRQAHLDRLALKSTAGNHSAIVDNVIYLQQELIRKMNKLFPNPFWLSQQNRILEYLLRRPRGGNSVQALRSWLSQLDEPDILSIYNKEFSFLRNLLDEKDRYYESLRKK